MRYIPEGELVDPRAAKRSRRRAILIMCMLLVAFLVGAPGAYLVSNTFSANYTATGTLWIANPSRMSMGEAGRGNPNGLLVSTAWTELLLADSVLVPVVLANGLYIRAPEDYAPAFATFRVSGAYEPGTYEFRVGHRGETFALIDSEGTVLQRGFLGSPVGDRIGFIWTPSRGSFTPEATVQFTVLGPRDAAEDLSELLTVATDRKGNFIEVGLNGPDPNQTADVVNAVMDRFVDLASELRNAQAKKVHAILEGQAQSIELELEQAGEELEKLRVAQISEALDRPSADADPRVEEEGLIRDIQALEGLYSELRTRSDQARLAAATPVSDVRILDRAFLPRRSSGDTRVPVAVSIFLGCIAAALGGALVLDRMATAREAAS